MIWSISQFLIHKIETIFRPYRIREVRLSVKCIMYTENGIFKRIQRISLKTKASANKSTHKHLFYRSLYTREAYILISSIYWWHWTMVCAHFLHKHTDDSMANCIKTIWIFCNGSLYMNDHNTGWCVYRVSIVCSKAQKPYRLMKALRCNLEFVQWWPNGVEPLFIVRTSIRFYFIAEFCDSTFIWLDSEVNRET